MAGMAFGQEMIYPPTHQYFIHKDGQATLIEYKNWKIFSPTKFHVDALITELDHQGALLWMIKCYGDSVYDLRDFAALSKNWNPKVSSEDPNAIIPEIIDESPTDDRERMYPLLEPVWRSHTGKRYHTATCFWRGLVPIQLTLLDAMLQGLTPCGHCKPFVEE